MINDEINQFSELLKVSKKFPDHPGVYFFRDIAEKNIYIGKATSLKNRVANYFRADLDSHKKLMVQNAQSLTYELTDTVLEALILETNYIKKFKPKFNIITKDDKSSTYLAFSDEDYPRLFTIRAREYDRYLAKDAKITKKYKIKRVFGPFMTADAINKVMKIILPIFPYRICNYPEGKICLYGRMGQCPLHRKNKLTKNEYAKQLKYIAKIFQGKMPKLIIQLDKEMILASKTQKYELAQQLRDQIFALKHINDISLIENTKLSDAKIPQRLEAYDISHFGGKDAVGVFVVFENGKTEKSQYRKFIIRGAQTKDDIAMLKEVLRRRFNHPEWIDPEIILLDGGIGQLNAGKKVLTQFKKQDKIVLISSAKGPKRNKTDLFWSDDKQKDIYDEKELLKIIKFAIAEAHRFAITFQKKKRKF